MGEPEPLGKILAKKNVVTPRRKKLALELIRCNWGALVGDRLAGQTAPTKLARGTLTVAANGGSWASELCLKESELLRGVKGILGEGAVRALRVKARALTVEQAGAATVERWNEAVEPGPEDYPMEEGLRDGLGRVEDPEVREALLRLVRTSRTSGQNKQKEK